MDRWTSGHLPPFDWKGSPPTPAGGVEPEPTFALPRKRGNLCPPGWLLSGLVKTWTLKNNLRRLSAGVVRRIFSISRKLENPLKVVSFSAKQVLL
jgi:hypothetical protein